MNATTGNAVRSQPRATEREIEVCAQCHARRGQIAEGYEAGKPFLDHYRPALLTSPLYHADGQQRGEVYNWGSFLQSKMYANGVTCSDCHNPHSGKLRAEGNALCATCHVPSKYDTAAHHHHKPASAGAACVACHMPTTTYMVVDPRHDHSLRVPRPDLSVKLGTPNACNGCHTNRDARWAAKQVNQWYGHDPQGYQRFAAAFAAADGGRAGCASATARDRRGYARSLPLPERRHWPESTFQLTDPARRSCRGLAGSEFRGPARGTAITCQRAAERARVLGRAAAIRPGESGTHRSREHSCGCTCRTIDAGAARRI